MSMTGTAPTTSDTCLRSSARSVRRACRVARASGLLIVMPLPFDKSEAHAGRRARVRGVGPAVVRDRRRPAGPERVLVVRVTAQTFVKLGVLGQLVAVEPHAQARPLRDGDGAVLVLERAALDDVVRQVMVVRVGREREVRDGGA